MKNVLFSLRSLLGEKTVPGTVSLVEKSLDLETLLLADFFFFYEFAVTST